MLISLIYGNGVKVNARVGSGKIKKLKIKLIFINIAYIMVNVLVVLAWLHWGTLAIAICQVSYIVITFLWGKTHVDYEVLAYPGCCGYL